MVADMAQAIIARPFAWELVTSDQGQAHVATVGGIQYAVTEEVDHDGKLQYGWVASNAVDGFPVQIGRCYPTIEDAQKAVYRWHFDHAAK